MKLSEQNIFKSEQEKLKSLGFVKGTVALNEQIAGAVMRRDFEKIDELFQFETGHRGSLYNYMSKFGDFSEIEFIISLRQAKNEWEEDGIWHDDGSRTLAFSLSLQMDIENIRGGNLHIRKKGSQNESIIKPFSYGEIVVFLTGTSGFEHKIHKVECGERLIIAGWCS